MVKDDELAKLKGGDWCGDCGIFYGQTFIMYGYSCGTSSSAAENICEQTYRPIFGPEINCYCDGI